MPEEPNEADSIESLHIYSHFTITADNECPTSDLNLKERVIFSLLAKGTQFFLYLSTTGSYGEVFQWLDEGGSSTDIAEVKSESSQRWNNATVMYDLSGRRVLSPKKGVYILNGKKVIIK